MQPQVIQTNLKIDHFQASMVLAAVGDAMGYKNGEWEFLTNSKILHEKMMQLTNNKGPLALDINAGWKYSDDTVMHIATAKALLAHKKKSSLNQICQSIGKQYKACWSKMGGRAPGKTTGKMIKVMNEDGSNWNKIPYNDRGCGCGGSMRSACIGLAYYSNTEKLIALSIESGRMTHHNPIGYLGSMIASYFTGLAVKGIHPNKWAAYFFDEGIKMAENYVKEAGREVKLNFENGYWQKFVSNVKSYCESRNISMKLTEETEPKFPEEYGVIEREHFYKKLSWGGWPGALGIDSVLIAYDALLSSKGSWEELCLRGILHGGDNDSTGTIAGAWFGAFYGWKGVPKNHYLFLEDGKKLMVMGENLFNLQ